MQGAEKAQNVHLTRTPESQITAEEWYETHNTQLYPVKVFLVCVYFRHYIEVASLLPGNRNGKSLKAPYRPHSFQWSSRNRFSI